METCACFGVLPSVCCLFGLDSPRWSLFSFLLPGRGGACIALGWAGGTGNREQGTGNREQGTGNGERGTGNGERGTEDVLDVGADDGFVTRGSPRRWHECLAGAVAGLGDDDRLTHGGGAGDEGG
eukprot:3932025-Rhodomonas_salina.2